MILHRRRFANFVPRIATGLVVVLLSGGPAFSLPRDRAETRTERRETAANQVRERRAENTERRQERREETSENRAEARDNAAERRTEAAENLAARRADRKVYWESRLGMARRNLEEWYQRRLVRLTEIRNIASNRQDADTLARVDRLEARLKELYERRTATLNAAEARLRG